MPASPLPEAVNEPVAPAPSAFAAAWLSWRAQLGRRLLFVGGLCVGISILLAAIDGRGLGYKLVYSLCIGLVCMALIGGTRLAAVWVVERVRRWRGRATSDTSARVGWRGVLPGALLAIVVGPSAGLWLGDVITGQHSPSLLSLGESSSRVTLVLSLLGTVVSVVVLSTLARLQAARAQAEAAQRLAAENQLRLLQSQLEPHMLFNTLANLRVLIGLDPARALAMLDHLIAFLRATLNASRQAEHPLATEFEHLADYLALMAVRMGPRLQVRLDLPAPLATLAVPPLLLQPLVENSIKHGLEPQVEGGRIEVRAQQQERSLVLTVRDTGVGLGTADTPAGGGFGLVQVRQRLATLYGGRARLTLQAVTDGDGGVLATIRLPMP